MGILSWSGVPLGALVACLGLPACGGRLDAFQSKSSGLIDDFEDGNTESAIPSAWWYTTDDGSTAKPTMEVAPPSDHPGDAGALHFAGGPFTTWGAILGIAVDGGSDPGYDGARFSSLRFSARAEPTSEHALQVYLLETRQSASGTVWYSLHYDLTLTDVWAEYAIPFTSFAYDMDPTLRLDPSHLRHLQFFVQSPTAFDIWVDDVWFAHDR